MADVYNPELKPCPFCGGEAQFGIESGYVKVSCKECGISTKRLSASVEYCAKQLIAETWNRRVNND